MKVERSKLELGVLALFSLVFCNLTKHVFLRYVSVTMATIFLITFLMVKE